MRSTGALLLVLGVGSFVLPMFGLQFKLLQALGDTTPYVGSGLAVVGAILLLVSLRSSGTQAASPPEEGSSTE